MGTMLRSGIILAMLGSAASAASAETIEKTCISTAAERLPRVPGIAISASRTVPVPAEMAAKLDPKLFHAIVEIDAQVAGVDTTYKFICVGGNDGPTIVQRIL